ncbi:MAG: hypothetical protein HPY60_11145 [Candidatus Methanofastidiosum sp.]|nr:hypothetical protein [Methanofastidiosum sp.]
MDLQTIFVWAQAISVWASIIGCGISIYLVKNLPNIFHEYFETTEYNEIRTEIMNQFKAHIKLLTEDEQPIDVRMETEIYNNICRLNKYSTLFRRDIRKTIKNMIEMLESSDKIDRKKLVQNLTKLKTACESPIRKGLLI